jgi:hypothetical protein
MRPEHLQKNVAELLEVTEEFLFVDINNSFHLQKGGEKDIEPELILAPGTVLEIDRVILSKNFFTSSKYFFRFKSPNLNSDSPYIYGTEDYECEEPLYLSDCFSKIDLVLK